MAALLLGGAVQAAPDWWRPGAILAEGAPELYLSGYARHGRGTYSRERLKELNEQAWGAGAGKTLRNAAGDDESLYLFGISDSHGKAQWMAGYAYQWSRPLPLAGWEASVGLTGQLISRRDYFGGLPFPLLLPLAAIGPPRAQLMFSYVPRLSKKKGSGDVLFVFMRVRLD